MQNQQGRSDTVNNESDGRAFRYLGSDSTGDVCLLVLVGECFEGLLLGLWDKQRGEDSRQHEEGKDFHAIRRQSFR